MPIVLQEKKIEKIVERVTLRILKRVLKNFDEFALLAQKGKSFDFLFEEPDLYSKKDLFLTPKRKS